MKYFMNSSHQSVCMCIALPLLGNGSKVVTVETNTRYKRVFCIFLDIPIYLQSVEIHSGTFSKWCVVKRGRVAEYSVAPLRNFSMLSVS
jgi:hypothetical protein